MPHVRGKSQELPCAARAKSCPVPHVRGPASTWTGTPHHSYWERKARAGPNPNGERAPPHVRGARSVQPGQQPAARRHRFHPRPPLTRARPVYRTRLRRRRQRRHGGARGATGQPPQGLLLGPGPARLHVPRRGRPGLPRRPCGERLRAAAARKRRREGLEERAEGRAGPGGGDREQDSEYGPGPPGVPGYSRIPIIAPPTRFPTRPARPGRARSSGPGFGTDEPSDLASGP